MPYILSNYFKVFFTQHHCELCIHVHSWCTKKWYHSKGYYVFLYAAPFQNYSKNIYKSGKRHGSSYKKCNIYDWKISPKINVKRNMKCQLTLKSLGMRNFESGIFTSASNFWNVILATIVGRTGISVKRKGNFSLWFSIAMRK